MEKIKVGIIGCGHLGKMHLKNIKEIEKERKDIELKGIYDIDIDKSKLIAQENKTNYFNSLDDILNDINAAIIVSPTSTHFDIALKTISKNIHTFIEKPVTDKLENAYLLRADRDGHSKTIVQVGHIERFNPALLSVEKYNLKPLFIESHRLSQYNPRGTDVSVIQDLMIHDIDIILSLVKSRVKQIDANGVAIITDKYDIANARLQFENGCVANITASRISQKKMRKMRIFQNDAYISIDFSENKSEVFKLEESNKSKNVIGSINKKGKVLNITYDKPKTLKLNAMKYEENSFFDCIKNGTTPIVSLEDGIQALEVATEIIQKIEENRIEV
ncbi:MAG: Gfo/Idh/MocA family oxidoreductase [Ignavibacteriae bacterium]|nr:Gfo/Idh/MocA family oxidoreductase [Ignavibacteriota bacterium]